MPLPQLLGLGPRLCSRLRLCCRLGKPGCFEVGGCAGKQQVGEQRACVNSTVGLAGVIGAA